MCYINAVASSLQVHGDPSRDSSGRSLQSRPLSIITLCDLGAMLSPLISSCTDAVVSPRRVPFAC
jgi:hypothetical protein